jgi:hypothetical protein
MCEDDDQIKTTLDILFNNNKFNEKLKFVYLNYFHYFIAMNMIKIDNAETKMKLAKLIGNEFLNQLELNYPVEMNIGL